LKSAITSSIRKATEVSDYDSAYDSDDEPKNIFKHVKTNLLETEGVDIEGRYDESQQLALIFVNTVSWKLANITEDIDKGGCFNADCVLEQTTLMLHTRTLKKDEESVLSKMQSESRKAFQDELTNVSKRLLKAVIPRHQVLWNNWTFVDTIIKNGKCCVIMNNCVIAEGGQIVGKVVGKGRLLFREFPVVSLLSNTPGRIPASYMIRRSDLQSLKFHIQEAEGSSEAKGSSADGDVDVITFSDEDCL
jgi:hypothetical protein